MTDYRLCKDDEFRCDNGQCIPLEYKCKKYREEQMGCVDKSHLRNCGMLNVNVYIYCYVWHTLPIMYVSKWYTHS